MKKAEKFENIYTWLPIKSFNNAINLKNGDSIKILEVKPINFKLRSDAEQIAILESYKNFLKQCNFEIQIIVQAYKADIKQHLEKVENYSYGNEKLKNMMNSYKNLVMDIVSQKTSITRRFFIVIKSDKNIDENIEKITKGLNACGNEVILCDKKTIKEILKVYFFKYITFKEE